MNLLIAPATLSPVTAPSVGIFWRVGDHLLVDRSTLEEAEEYGDCLTHGGGHCEQWEVWQELPAASWYGTRLSAALRDSEYEDWPRGRIVFERETAKFILYMDRRLQILQVISALVEAFGLTGAAVVVRSDAHYC